jgi:hypothetical protein
MADYRQLAGALTNGDTIQATPRNPMLGGVADLLGMAYKVPDMPKIGVPGIDLLMANRNKVMDLLGIGDVQKTANTLSYGGAVGTGKGMTYRPKDETIGAAMTLAPMVAPVARMVGKGAVETGRFVAPPESKKKKPPHAAIAGLVGTGLTAPKIAEKLGITPWVVYRSLRKQGITIPDGRNK